MRGVSGRLFVSAIVMMLALSSCVHHERHAYIPPTQSRNNLPQNVPPSVAPSVPVVPAKSGLCSTLNGTVTVQSGSCASPPPSISPFSPSPSGNTQSPPPSASCKAVAPSAAAASSGLIPYHGGSSSGVPVILGCANVIVICVNAPCSTYDVDDSGTKHNESPCTFWNRLNASPMIHIADEYVGVTSNNRYPCISSIEVDQVPTGFLSDPELMSIISTATSGNFNGASTAYSTNANSNGADGTGSTAVYALFITVEQLGGTGSNHSSGQIKVNGQEQPILYAAMSNDDNENGMEHEMFESITDPNFDGGTGWWKNGADSEIGDVCQGKAESSVTLSGVSYTIQSIWSNKLNKCTYTPP